jgi:hypothetical protein
MTGRDLTTLREIRSPIDDHPNPVLGLRFFDAAIRSLAQGLVSGGGLACAVRLDGVLDYVGLSVPELAAAPEQRARCDGQSLARSVGKGCLPAVVFAAPELLAAFVLAIARRRPKRKVLIVEQHNREHEGRADTEQQHTVDSLQGAHDLPVRLEHNPRSASRGDRIDGVEDRTFRRPERAKP